MAYDSGVATPTPMCERASLAASDLALSPGSDANVYFGGTHDIDVGEIRWIFEH